MTSHNHNTDQNNEHNCDKEPSSQVMCVCDHNPGAECHCPPNESKCDQKHHLEGVIQQGNACCT